MELNKPLTFELEQLKSFKSQLLDQKLDLEAARDRLLAGFKVGKQSPR